MSLHKNNMNIINQVLFFQGPSFYNEKYEYIDQVVFLGVSLRAAGDFILSLAVRRKMTGYALLRFGDFLPLQPGTKSPRRVVRFFSRRRRRPFGTGKPECQKGNLGLTVCLGALQGCHFGRNPVGGVRPRYIIESREWSRCQLGHLIQVKLCSSISE